MQNTNTNNHHCNERACISLVQIASVIVIGDTLQLGLNRDALREAGDEPRPIDHDCCNSAGRWAALGSTQSLDPVTSGSSGVIKAPVVGQSGQSAGARGRSRHRALEGGKRNQKGK